MERPRLYLQNGFDEDAARIRIIYPDGSSEWLCNGDPEKEYAPCWAAIQPLYHGKGKNRTQQEAIRAMRHYDDIVGWPSAHFLGYL